MIVLACLSVISIALIVFKLLQLSGALSGQKARSEAIEAARSGDLKAAASGFAQGKAPASIIAGDAATRLLDGTPRHVVEAEAERRGNLELARMNSYIRLLELIAMVAPLLGLLGTVLGMIESFQELELAHGAANASVLAGGIWQALLTTAAGLVVAIPAAIGAGLLSARIDRAALEIEATVAELLAIHDTRHAA